MTKGADWLAANDHPKGRRPAAAREWVRARGETWYRPAPPKPGDADSAPDDEPRRRLIAATRVADAAVYSRGGRRIGRIAEVAIDEATGEVAFILLAEGGFLGFGERLRRLPWSALSYQAQRGGYVLDLAEAERDGALKVAGKVAFQRAADRGGWAADAQAAGPRDSMA